MKFSEFLNQKQLNERVTPEFRDEFGKQETRRLMSNISNHRRAMDVRIGNKTEMILWPNLQDWTMILLVN